MSVSSRVTLTPLIIKLKERLKWNLNDLLPCRLVQRTKVSFYFTSPIDAMPGCVQLERAGPGGKLPAHLTRIPIPLINTSTNCANKKVKVCFESFHFSVAVLCHSPWQKPWGYHQSKVRYWVVLLFFPGESSSQRPTGFVGSRRIRPESCHPR